MNFLQLVQRFRQETHYANAGPTAVTGQTGDHARAVSWVNDAHRELQNHCLWRWMRKEFTLTTSSGTATYDYTSCQDVATSTAISRFKRWGIQDRLNPPKIYLQSAGEGTETFMTYIPWESFRLIYEIGTQNSAFPSHITIDPADNLVLGPTPDGTYVVTGEYHRSAKNLAADTDTPEFPSDYHMAIVYLAMEDNGFFEAADEIVMRAQRKGRKLIRQMETLYAPRMSQAGPMA